MYGHGKVEWQVVLVLALTGHYFLFHQPILQRILILFKTQDINFYKQ